MKKVKVKPPTHTHTEVVNAITQRVTELMKSHGSFNPVQINVRAFSEFAQNPTMYEKEIIIDKLSRRGIVTLQMMGDAYLFKNRA